MAEENNTASTTILGREYKIKCPDNKLAELQASAVFLNKKMQEINNSDKIISMDNIAVITALNISYELLATQKQRTHYINTLHQRIKALERRIESALSAA